MTEQYSSEVEDVRAVGQESHTKTKRLIQTGGRLREWESDLSPLGQEYFRQLRYELTEPRKEKKHVEEWISPLTYIGKE